jgi:hypothetical protein
MGVQLFEGGAILSCMLDWEELWKNIGGRGNRKG